MNYLQGTDQAIVGTDIYLKAENHKVTYYRRTTKTLTNPLNCGSYRAIRVCKEK